MHVFEGFIIGIVGSLHCVGMCGPLALALPLPNKSAGKKALGALFYNLGRAVTYALLGLVFGFVGAGFKLSGLQQWVSIVCGALMIFSVIIPGVFKMPKTTQKVSGKLYATLKNKIGGALQQRRLSNLPIIGFLNGFLPCGLVYIAIAGAITSSTITESIIFMFLFGLGTLPIMFAVAYFADVIKNRFLHKMKHIIPVFIIILGLLFILRGLNLGIPYVSPKFEEDKVACCH